MHGLLLGRTGPALRVALRLPALANEGPLLPLIGPAIILKAGPMSPINGSVSPSDIPPVIVFIAILVPPAERIVRWPLLLTF